MSERLYRRFILINSQNEEKLWSLVKEKSLTREDIMLILSTLSLRKDIFH